MGRKFHCARHVLRGVMLLVLLVVLFPPFRNTVIPVPNAWHPLSTLEVLKATKRFLSTPGGDGLAALSACTDPHLFKQYHAARTASTSTVLKYEPRQVKDINTSDEELYERAHKWVSLSEENRRRFTPFLPAMNTADKKRLIETWRTFHDVCSHLNISYVFLDGSALGALRHRGLIPWDDDIDLGVDVQHLERLQRALSCVPGYTLRVQRNMHWKFFADDGHVSPTNPPARTFLSRVFSSPSEAENYELEYETTEHVVMRFPFLDLFFLTSDEDFTWALNSYTLPLTYIRNSELYPLSFQPFEGYLAPVPRYNRQVMDTRYAGLKNCVSPSYNHAEGQSKGKQVTIPCMELANMYPTVHL